MRVTTSMLFSRFASYLSTNLSDLVKVQAQLSSGKKLTKPSDDAIGIAQILDYKVSLNAVAQFSKNTDKGTRTLGYTDNTLNSVENVLLRVKELALSASNDTASAETRLATSYETQNLLGELLALGNTNLNGNYIFAGFQTNTQPFDSSGTYQGDTGSLEIYIDSAIKKTINVTGDSAFSDSTKQISAALGNTAGAGEITITSGSNNPVTLDPLTNASPEEVRDAMNAPMSDFYDVADAIGTGTLTLKSGNASPVTLTVDGTNNQPAQLRDAINALNMGIEAGLATDTGTNDVRLFFRPTTPGESFSIEVLDDGDGNDRDASGLSALLHTETKSNLTRNALGIESFVINDTAGKRMLFSPTVANASYTIAINDGDGDDTDTAGLSRIASNNLTGSISFFTMLDHLTNSLATNDMAGIQASSLLLDGAMDQVINVRADVGSRIKYIEDHQFGLEDDYIFFSENLSKFEDADIAEAATEMAKIQTSLEAMRIASLQVLSKSLFDFLR